MSKGHFVLFLLLILLILPLILLQSALAAQTTIAWNAESGVAGYNAYYGINYPAASSGVLEIFRHAGLDPASSLFFSGYRLSPV